MSNIPLELLKIIEPDESIPLTHLNSSVHSILSIVKQQLEFKLYQYFPPNVEIMVTGAQKFLSSQHMITCIGPYGHTNGVSIQDAGQVLFQIYNEEPLFPEIYDLIDKTKFCIRINEDENFAIKQINDIDHYYTLIRSPSSRIKRLYKTKWKL